MNSSDTVHTPEKSGMKVNVRFCFRFKAAHAKQRDSFQMIEGGGGICRSNG